MNPDAQFDARGYVLCALAVPAAPSAAIDKDARPGDGRGRAGASKFRVKVEVVAREPQYDALREDSDFIDLVDLLASKQDLLRLAIVLIRNYETIEQFRKGRGGRTARNEAQLFARNRRLSQAEQRAVNTIIAKFEILYQRHGGLAVRSYLIEALVVRALRSTYSGPSDFIDDNVTFRLVNCATYTSSTSIDAIAFSGTRQHGECHDCKLQARGWGKHADWIRELERELPARQMRLGRVTTDARDAPELALAAAGIAFEHGRLIPLGSLWQFVPLQAAQSELASRARRRVTRHATLAVARNAEGAEANACPSRGTAAYRDEPDCGFIATHLPTSPSHSSK